MVKIPIVLRWRLVVTEHRDTIGFRSNHLRWKVINNNHQFKAGKVVKGQDLSQHRLTRSTLVNTARSRSMREGILII
ncbi:hypothetical protein M8C21_022184 [Ambrosia artemisiifolia]|uniref:Uncharacterized protein n=1 Tax=Ambrosia artemisiifolia TaxID=4212 RepID=A0AAD5GK15_AMBAR|nr:hypothetical protein M8C21_022184 [Ambrosia artemisiifolia]